MFSILNIIFIIVFTLYSSIYCFDQKSKLEGLYDKNDNVLIIKGDRKYNEIMINNETILVIEFYNSWCGHCIRFAPTWKSLSKNIIGWNSVIRLVTVDCNNEDNSNICRYMNINGVPSIKMFSDERLPSDKGIEFIISDSGFSNASVIEDGIIDFLMSSNTSSFIHDKLSFDRNIDNIFENKKKVFMVFENSTSYLRKKLVLDFIMDKSLIFISITSQRLFTKFNITAENIPSVYRVDGRNNPVKLISFRNDNHLSVRKNVVEYLNSFKKMRKSFKPEITWIYQASVIIPDNNNLQINDIEILPSNKIYMQDLLSAVHYSMTHEIANNRLIVGDTYVALRKYVHVLCKYLPVPPKVLHYLIATETWLKTIEKVSGQDWLTKIRSLQMEYDVIPLRNNKWIGCRGSLNRYRGFPCSMWRLFHTLTVSAYEIDDTRGIISQDTLIAMRYYIQYFFGCRECATNFARGAKYIETQVHSRRDAILFLWKSHNRANKHLKGDLTEDPASPKIQFPSKQLCKECSTSDVWDNDEVFMFLRLMYRRQNIIDRDDQNYRRIIKQKSSASTFTNIDISLCAAFYILCMILLFNVFIRIKRKKNQKSIKSI